MTRLTALCRELKLGNMEEIAQTLEFTSHEQYLTDLLEGVLRQRYVRRTERLMRQARFPAPKTLETKRATAFRKRSSGGTHPDDPIRRLRVTKIT